MFIGISGYCIFTLIGSSTDVWHRFLSITDLSDRYFYFVPFFYPGKHCITGTIPFDIREDVEEDIFIVTSLQVFDIIHQLVPDMIAENIIITLY